MPGWSMGYTWNWQGGSNRDSVSWEMPWCCPGRQLERKSLPSASLLNLVALNLKQRDHSSLWEDQLGTNSEAPFAHTQLVSGTVSEN